MKALLALPKEKLQKIILVAIVTLIGVSAVGYLYIGAQINTLTASRQRIAELKPKVEQAEDGVKHEVQSGAVRDQMKVFVETQRAKMITGDSFSWVVRELSLLAEKHPVRVVGIRPAGTTAHSEKTRYQMFITLIELEGKYDQLGNFVRDLENSFPAGQIRSLQLSPTDAARALCRGALEFAWVVLPDSDQAETTAKPKEEAKKTS